MLARTLLIALTVCVAASIAAADEQQIAPGTGLQSAVVVNTGADGICNTTAAAGDIQAATVGSATPYLTEIHCGPNKTADSVATGDDTQLVALGAPCKGTNTAVIDTGPDGIPNTVLAGDDTYASGITLGMPPPNKACVIAGADGVAQTAAAMGDDQSLLAAGTAQANTAVVLCGPNGIADTAANNDGAGDDVQDIPVGTACNTNDGVVDSGPDGIATTRAEGPDLQIKAVNKVRVNIGKGQSFARKTIRFTILNTEFGAMAPLNRSYTITVTGSTCPNGTVTQIDADSSTPAPDAVGTVAFNGTAHASLVVTVHLEDITTSTTKAPFRCSFDVNVVSTDTAPDVDDGANPEGNTTTVQLESIDHND